MYASSSRGFIFSNIYTDIYIDTRRPSVKGEKTKVSSRASAAIAHTYMFVCIHTCIHAYIQTNMHTYVHTYIYICMHTHIHKWIIYIETDL